MAVLHFERAIFSRFFFWKNHINTQRALKWTTGNWNSHPSSEKILTKLNHCIYFSMLFTFQFSVRGAVWYVRTHTHTHTNVNHYSLLGNLITCAHGDNIFFFRSRSLSPKLEHGSFRTVPNAQLNNAIWFAFNTTITLHFIIALHASSSIGCWFRPFSWRKQHSHTNEHWLEAREQKRDNFACRMVA